MDQLDDIIKEFLIESYENLDRLDQDLMALEEIPDDRDRLSNVFRTIHTIKGTSGFLAFNHLEHVTHVGESLLVMLRDGKLRLNRAIANALLAMVDAVRSILANIEAGRGEGETDYGDLVATLQELQVAGEARDSSGSDCDESRLVTKTIDSIVEQVATLTESLETPVLVPSSENHDVKQKRKRRKKSSSGISESTAIVARSEVQAERLATVDRDSIRDASEVAEKTAKIQDELHLEALKFSSMNESEGSDRGHSQSVSDSTVRIDVSLLDRLMNLVGELVLARNQILQHSRSTEDASLIAATQRLNLITTELQEGVMKTRMQPIQNVWGKLPRVVRDLSQTCNKKVQVKMEGAETELDKTILEAIRDPLTHIVRNSVDHGIEAPEVRVASGKPAEGTLLLRAFHESGKVVIEISDDGGGINLDRVKEKAISQGLISTEQASSMSERDLMNLIVLPGFSTAAAVTNVSGRGVGMDVVKTNVEKIGGTLDINSVYGQGTTLRIKIPLTLAIVPALMVSSGEDRYAIPQNSLVELVRLEGGRIREIEHIHDVPVYRLRGNLLPLLFLDEQLGLRPPRTGTEFTADSVMNIVVLNADDRQFGLVVDRVNDTEEIVVKPLGPHLKEISTYAGATIMGDGTVSLILDVLGMARRAQVVTTARERPKAQVRTIELNTGNQKHTLLLVGMGESDCLAIPLSVVARLEDFPIDSVEWADGRQVVQYSGQIMPLIHLGRSLRGSHYQERESHSLKVVVYSESGRSVGLVVDRILDIVETTLTIQQSGKRAGVLGSAVIQSRVTDLLDIPNLILSTDENCFGTSPPSLAV